MQNTTSVQKFYSDIDRLHEAVKPFMYQYRVNRFAEAWLNLKNTIGNALIDALNIVAK